MDKLWSTRKAPVPLSWGEWPEGEEEDKQEGGGIQDQALWSVKKCAEVFADSIKQLKEKLKVRGNWKTSSIL